MGCNTTININLLKPSDDEMSQVKFPLLSAHTNYSPESLADFHSHKPLPEVTVKVEVLICHSHLSQISLMLALKGWVNHDFIPQHL